MLFATWFKNSVFIEDGNMYNSSVTHDQGLVLNSLQISYNNAKDVIGNYVGFTWTDTYEFLSGECIHYYNYLRDIGSLLIRVFIFEVSYWKISGELLIYSHFLAYYLTVQKVINSKTFENCSETLSIHNYCVCVYNDRSSISSVPTFWRVSAYTSRVNYCELYCCR